MQNSLLTDIATLSAFIDRLHASVISVIESSEDARRHVQISLSDAYRQRKDLYLQLQQLSMKVVAPVAPVAPAVASPTAQDRFRHACQRGQCDVVRVLLSDPRVDPSADDNAALRSASEFGHTDVVKMLLADARVAPRVWFGASATPPAVPAAPETAPDVPVVVAHDVLAPDVPVVPALDVPALDVPAPDVPVVPAPDVPIVVALDVPAPDVPVVVAPDGPAVVAPETAHEDADAFVGFIATADGKCQRIVLHEVDWDDSSLIGYDDDDF